jgi:hypothetical protein
LSGDVRRCPPTPSEVEAAWNQGLTVPVDARSTLSRRHHFDPRHCRLHPREGRGSTGCLAVAGGRSSAVTPAELTVIEPRASEPTLMGWLLSSSIKLRVRIDVIGVLLSRQSMNFTCSQLHLI